MFALIYEEQFFNVTSELLDFYESIVKPENIQFLFQILMPLHAAELLHEKLVACIGDPAETAASRPRRMKLLFLRC
jgi:hypothetical protein